MSPYNFIPYINYIEENLKDPNTAYFEWVYLLKENRAPYEATFYKVSKSRVKEKVFQIELVKDTLGVPINSWLELPLFIFKRITMSDDKGRLHFTANLINIRLDESVLMCQLNGGYIEGLINATKKDPHELVMMGGKILGINVRVGPIRHTFIVEEEEEDGE